MLILSEAIKNGDSHDEISILKERRETIDFFLEIGSHYVTLVDLEFTI